MRLPCTNCGNSLDLISGAVIQCFACGTKNIHLDSLEIFSHFVQDIFGYPKAIEEIEDEVSEKIIMERVKKVDELFNELLKKVNKIDTLVLTKIFPNTDKEMLPASIKLSKTLGMLKILIENYILPHIDGTLKKQYLEVSVWCEIYHLGILGHRFSLEAKENFKSELISELYEHARWNFENASELSDKYSSTEWGFNFQEEIGIFSISAQFCSILSDILNENPTHYSDNFEELMQLADKLSNSKARVLKNEIKRIYDKANELPTIFEEIRVIHPINRIDSAREKILYHSEEVIEELTNVKIWLSDVEERYKNLQSEIVKLHAGQLIPYLRNYRQEFRNRLQNAAEKYNELIGKIVQTTLLDYTLSTSDLLEEMENGISFSPLGSSEIIEKIRLIKKDILSLDNELKNFLFEIIDYGINRSLKGEHSLSIVTSISDKHSSFDRLIYKFLKKILDGFISDRDEMRYTMEEQREKFNIEIRPIIENLIQISFTIKEEQVPFPLFMEVVILSTQLEVEKEYKIFFVIENPSRNDIDNVSVTFFVPNSFQIRTRNYDVGRLKPNKRLNIETRIVPTESGIFHFMAMAQYEYSKELFWMPSLKFKFKVLKNTDLSADIDEDQIINDIYKKYGKVVNNIEDSEGYVKDPQEITEKIDDKSDKKDDLLPDLENK